jgi:outer membrane biosynthesis protein TonB
VVTFSIDPDGSVHDSALSEDLPEPSVGACVLRVVSAMTFPPHDGGLTKVTYPFVFESSRPESGD